MHPSNKPLCSVSLDLDNKWSYMKTHGDARWTGFPSYLDIVVPRVLGFLAEHQLTITFFIVGQDAALPANHAALQQLRAAGHEIGNHSFHHEPWLHLYSRSQIEEELSAAEQAIEHATGYTPRGFRGPGFSVSSTVVDVLARRGYSYDASTLPTFLGPLARAYYFLSSNLSREEKQKRAKLFGSLKDGLRPLKPYHWDTQSGPIPEIPVTTMPVFRTPFHLSYLLYLAVYSAKASELYLRLALALCRLTNIAPSFLLHPLDFIGPDEAPELAFFPGMHLPLQKKLQVAGMALRRISDSFQVVPLAQQVAALADKKQMPLARSFSA